MDLQGATYDDLAKACRQTEIENRRLEAEVTRLVNEVQDCAMQAAKLRELIADPVAVHANMLAGTIAKPSVEGIIHIYGHRALNAALRETDGHPPCELIAPLTFHGDNCLCRAQPEGGCDAAGCPHRPGGNWSTTPTAPTAPFRSET